MFFQRRFVLLTAGDRPEQSRKLGPAGPKLEEPRGGADKHGPWHVAPRALRHLRHARRDPAHRHRLALGGAQARDTLQLRLPRGARKLPRLHDLLPGLPLARS